MRIGKKDDQTRSQQLGNANNSLKILYTRTGTSCDCELLLRLSVRRGEVGGTKEFSLLHPTSHHHTDSMNPLEGLLPLSALQNGADAG